MSSSSRIGLDNETSKLDLPIFVCPTELVFTPSKKRTLLTIFNPYGKEAQFNILTTSPERFDLSSTKGILKPNRRIDISIRMFNNQLDDLPIPSEDLETIDYFKIYVQIGTLKGNRQVKVCWSLTSNEIAEPDDSHTHLISPNDAKSTNKIKIKNPKSLANKIADPTIISTQRSSIRTTTRVSEIGTPSGSYQANLDQRWTSHSDTYDCQQDGTRRLSDAQRKRAHSWPQSLENLNTQSSFVKNLVADKSIFNYVTIEPITFLAVYALFIELPALQDLIYTKICIDTIKNSSLTSPDQSILFCDKSNKTGLPIDFRQKIEIKQQTFWLIFQLSIGLLCALTAPFWGSVSDRIGRLYPLNGALVCTAIANCIYLTAGLLISTGFHNSYSLEWLYVTVLIIGFSGGQAVIIVNSFGYISDVTSVENRSKRIVILDTVQNIAHTSAWLISKYIMAIGLPGVLGLGWLNRHSIAFIFCIFANLIGLLYSILLLRRHSFHIFLNNFEREQQESIASPDVTNSTSVIELYRRPPAIRAHQPEANRTRTPIGQEADAPTSSIDALVTVTERSCSILRIFDHYKQTMKTLCKKRESRALILLLLLCGFISYTHLSIILSLLYNHLTTSPFNFNTSDYSNWNLKTSLLQGLSFIGLSISMRLVKGWNLPDPLVATMGFLSKAIGLMVIGLAHSSQLINLVPLILIFSEFTMPPIRSILSKLVVSEEVGKIYSCQSALTSICLVSSNVIFYIAFNSLIQKTFYRICFIGVASLQLGAGIIMLYIYTILRGRSNV